MSDGEHPPRRDTYAHAVSADTGAPVSGDLIGRLDSIGPIVGRGRASTTDDSDERSDNPDRASAHSHR